MPSIGGGIALVVFGIILVCAFYFAARAGKDYDPVTNWISVSFTSFIIVGLSGIFQSNTLLILSFVVGFGALGIFTVTGIMSTKSSGTSH